MSVLNSQKIRVADYIFRALKDFGVNHVFLVTGGGAMHLNDAIGRVKDLKWVACHHEQACAMAAESYYRNSNRLAVVNVTSGPGGTNAITGVYGAWTDSVGMFVVSGNVKWETLVRSTNLPLRQLGDQEVDIIRIIEPITKYSVCVDDPQTIRYHVEKALYLAVSGRPGPVWLDIPMNVQSAQIDPSKLKGFNIEDEFDQGEKEQLTEKCHLILEKLMQAQRPVILAGSGVRLSGAAQKFIQLAEKLKIPVTTAWNSHDLIWDNHPCYVGRPGTVGDRSGNFAIQNSDLVLILGSRLNIRQLSYNWNSFAREAYKIMIDIDEAELKKPTLKIDLPINANVKDVIEELLQLTWDPQLKHSSWLQWCVERKEKYPTVLPEYWELKEKVNPYCFVKELFSQLTEDEQIVTGDGTACVVTFQAAIMKKGQRLYTNSGCASMGYDLPAAIGAYFANEHKKIKRLICLAGDGSIQMNLQELQTVITHKIPLKLFILNNQGYHSIRQTQHNYFSDNIIGCGKESGLDFPSFGKIADTFGFGYRECKNHSALAEVINLTLNSDGPQICEVFLDLNQQFSPKLSSKKLPDGRMISSPLEDMAPFLPREEFLKNMIIEPLSEN